MAIIGLELGGIDEILRHLRGCGAACQDEAQYDWPPASGRVERGLIQPVCLGVVGVAGLRQGVGLVSLAFGEAQHHAAAAAAAAQHLVPVLCTAGISRPAQHVQYSWFTKAKSDRNRVRDDSSEW